MFMDGVVSVPPARPSIHRWHDAGNGVETDLLFDTLGCRGYRNDNTSGVAVGNEEETLYMVTSGQFPSPLLTRLSPVF